MRALLLLLFIAHVLSNEWVDKRYTGPMKANSYRQAHYLSQAEKIRFNVQCEKVCSIALLTYQNYVKFVKGETYEYIRYIDNTLHGEYEFSDVSVIRQGVTMFVLNKLPEIYRISVLTSNFMIPFSNKAEIK